MFNFLFYGGLFLICTPVIGLLIWLAVKFMPRVWGRQTVDTSIGELLAAVKESDSREKALLKAVIEENKRLRSQVKEVKSVVSEVDSETVPEPAK